MSPRHAQGRRMRAPKSRSTRYSVEGRRLVTHLCVHGSRAKELALRDREWTHPLFWVGQRTSDLKQTGAARFLGGARGAGLVLARFTSRLSCAYRSYAATDPLACFGFDGFWELTRGPIAVSLSLGRGVFKRLTVI
jgi:hypothetical protein